MKTPNENTEQKPDSQQPNPDPKAASPQQPAAPDKGADKGGEKKEPKTVDLVTANRERLARAKDAGTGKDSDGSSKQKQSGSAKPDAKAKDGADEKPDLEEKDEEESAEEDADESLKLDESQFSKAGYFDRLNKGQWADLEKKYPDVARLVKAGKAEAQRYIETAKKKVANQPNDQKKPSSAATEETEQDVTDAIDLLYDPKTRKEGLTKLLTNKDSKDLIRSMFTEMLHETTGYDPSLQPLSEAIEIAADDYPLLKDADPAFFNEVDEHLKQDEEAYEELMSSDKPRLIAAAIRDAAAKVTRSRAAKQGKDVDKKNVGTKSDDRRAKLERDTQSAKEQAGVKAGGGQRPAVPDGDLRGADLVRSIREKKNYQHIGR